VHDQDQKAQADPEAAERRRIQQVEAKKTWITFIAGVLVAGATIALSAFLILGDSTPPPVVQRPESADIADRQRTQPAVETDKSPPETASPPPARPPQLTVQEIVQKHRAALRSEAAAVRAHAAQSLSIIGPDAVVAVPDLMVAAGDRETAVRVAAVRALGNIAEEAKEAISTLVGSLLDSNAEVQSAAVDALEAIGLPAVVDFPVLRAAAASPNARVRLYVVEALPRIKWNGQDVVSIVAALSKDKDRAVRLAAIAAWGKVGMQDKKVSLDGLVNLLKDAADPDEAKACTQALSALGPLTANEIPALAAALKTRSSAIRLIAVTALGSIGPEARLAVPPLRQALKDEDPAVRKAVILALGEIGPAAAGARQDLVDLVKDKGADLRLTAAAALAKIDKSAELGPMWIALLGDTDDKMSELAIEALGAMDKLGKENIPALSGALKSNRSAVRACAATALGNVGPAAVQALTALINAMQDKDSFVRQSAVEALGKLGPEAAAATPQLVAALKDKALHDVAFKALVRIGKGAVPDLVRLLKIDEEKLPVKRDVIGILKEIGPDAAEAIKPLTRITSSFDELPSTRKAAAEALKAIHAK
jgi:HEAT repeat protein